MADSDPMPPTVTMPTHAAAGDGSGYLGQTLDNRYRIERLIGRGGMGSVYLARHVVIGRPLAVKILDARQLEDGQGFKRVFREAQTAAGIGHPNIVDVVDVGTTPYNDPYLVMEYLAGEDLAQLMSRTGPASVPTALAVLEPILRALVAAHGAGIVHRDLKPSNIFLVRHAGAPPSVKLIDFGVAKLLGPNPEGKITVTGALVGTPSYMSPEQAVGMETLDARVDLYAVGVILYEFLTGELPFRGANYNELIYHIVRDEVPPPCPPGAALPPEVVSLVLKATRKTATERYQSAAEMLEAFRSLAAWPEREAALVELAATIQTTDPDARSASAFPVHAGSSTSMQTRRSSQAATPRDLRVTLAEGTTRLATEGGRQPRSRLPLIAALVVIAALGAGGLAGLARRSPAPGAQTVTSTSDPDPTPEGVEIRVEGAPPGATVYFDGAPVADRRFRVRRSDLIVPLRVELAHHQAFVTTLAPRQDTTVRVRLVPLPSASAPPEPPNAASARPPKTPPSAPSATPIKKLGRDTYYTERFE